VGATTIASAGAVIDIGNVLSSSIHSMDINPSLAKQSFGSKKLDSPRKCPFLCCWGQKYSLLILVGLHLKRTLKRER
jgi:hypothetical protein